jgi:Fe-S protein assembly chaperone HscA
MTKISINIKEATINDTHAGTSELIAGIDLGTTNSLIAFFNNETGVANTVKKDGKNSLVPSIVHFDKKGNVTVGQEAKHFLTTDPANTIYSVKRLMGKAYRDVSEFEGYFGYRIIDEDKEQLVKIRVADKFYTPVELSALILKELKVIAEVNLSAERNQQVEIKKAVITVPAYFNDSQRQATRDAGKLAGLEVLRIINEPTAAALAYGIGINSTSEKTIGVYDLGGGTFDISILKIHPDNSGGIFEVLATNGDTFLGGDDFDREIVNFWIKKNNLDSTSLLEDKSLSQSLRLKAEEVKIFLATHESFKGMHDHIVCDITREEFEEITSHLVEKTMSCVKRALKDAKVNVDDIENIVMVGGATRIPLVKKTVADFFRKEVYDELNPDEVVALGAAIQANVLAGNQKDILLLDVTPLSLGIETIGDLMDVIIPRNSKVPVSAARQYTTSVDGQKNLKIAVYQGERDVVGDNRKLAEFLLTGIPAMPAGFPKIEISFIINADGILKVKAKELRSGLEQTIEVKPQYGLTDAEVEKMLLDSITHAKEDMQTRALLEAKTEATQVMASAEKFLLTNAAMLSEEDVAGMRAHIQGLEQSLKSGDKDLIHAKMDDLNEFTLPFAHRIMDAALSEAIKGRKI